MSLRIARPDTGWSAKPLERVVLTGVVGGIVVRDGEGRVYVRSQAAAGGELSFTVGGSLGTHVIERLDTAGTVVERVEFMVDAHTTIDDGGRFAQLHAALGRTMRCYSADGTGGITWRGKRYRHYVPWILDHAHTARGMCYESDATGEMIDLLAGAQRADGMIWSFAFADDGPAPGYHYWAYSPHGYAKVDGGVLFGRQPVENHCEYNFVDTLHTAWKSSGDDLWMGGHLQAAMRALDYGVSDRARWSSVHRLLKRGYTIDSWDFQPDDEHLVRFPLGQAQLIDPERTKFVVFFGDNTGYALACDQLAEMLVAAGRDSDAERYRARAAEIRARLDEVAWNGRFYRHHVEEDPSVRRDLGADEDTQMAMSNAYALNRGVSPAQARAIIGEYQRLRGALPHRSPGEWYAVYPPYGKGFGHDSSRWQYMNAGVHGHAAGELARGAFAHGFEAYGADILARIGQLAHAHGGIVRFAYTGGWDPPPPAPVFAPVRLDALATMDLQAPAAGAPAQPWLGEDGANDLRALPVGRQTFAGIPFEIADPAANARRCAVAVAALDARYPREAAIPIGRVAPCVYLLHAAGKVGGSGMAALLRFRYQDGGASLVPLMQGRQLGGWWFPQLKGTEAGVAWRGANPKCGDVGAFWAAVANPEPAKPVAALEVEAAPDGAIYGLLALTVADRMPWREADPVSTGGPDNWSGGLCMAALVEGLCGVHDDDRALRAVTLSPRWAAAGEDGAAAGRADVTIRYGASRGYVSYRWSHDATDRAITLDATGNAARARLRVLLPASAVRVAQLTVDGSAVAAREERVEASLYACCDLDLSKPARVRITYA